MTKREQRTLAREVESLLRTSASDMESLDFLPSDVATRRTDDLLRNLLNTPPDPRAAPAPKTKAKKTMKRAKK